MSRHSPTISCDTKLREELEHLAKSRTESKQIIERAQIVLHCLAGERVNEVARLCRTRPNTVIKWRQRFVQRAVLPGPLFASLSDFVKEDGFDLIICTTHGYSGFQHALRGSTAENLVRLVSCPVLIVRTPRPA